MLRWGLAYIIVLFHATQVTHLRMINVMVHEAPLTFHLSWWICLVGWRIGIHVRFLCIKDCIGIGLGMLVGNLHLGCIILKHIYQVRLVFWNHIAKLFLFDHVVVIENCLAIFRVHVSIVHGGILLLGYFKHLSCSLI